MPGEFHCHTIFSPDGHRTPEQVVDVAAERGITTLAITDHNHLGALERGRKRAQERGIRYVNGVEFDAVFRTTSYHFVCLGFDPAHAGLQKLAQHNAARYQLSFELQASKLKEFGFGIEAEELRQFFAQRYPTHPQPAANMWCARDFLLSKGRIKKMDDWKNALAKIKQQIVAERGPDVFGHHANYDEVRDAVHAASGVILLAHVGKYFSQVAEKELALIHDLLANKIDGFELHHPSNLALPHFSRLAAEAEKLNCLITGGSDCHDCLQPDSDTPLGSSKVSDAVYEKIEAVLAKRHPGCHPSRR